MSLFFPLKIALINGTADLDVMGTICAGLISLALVLPALVPLLCGSLLLLVKPQFELQPVDIGPGGKVKDASAYGHVEKKRRKACATNGLEVRDWFDSATPGSEGAREFFLYATHASDRTPS